jgi:hypothetical protein
MLLRLSGGDCRLGVGRDAVVSLVCVPLSLDSYAREMGRHSDAISLMMIFFREKKSECGDGREDDEDKCFGAATPK